MGYKIRSIEVKNEQLVVDCIFGSGYVAVRYFNLDSSTKDILLVFDDLDKNEKFRSLSNELQTLVGYEKDFVDKFNLLGDTNG